MPLTLADPDVHIFTPHNIWIVVVLPAPSGPTSPKISPFFTSRLIPLTATFLPYFFVRLLAVIAYCCIFAATILASSRAHHLSIEWSSRLAGRASSDTP